MNLLLHPSPTGYPKAGTYHIPAHLNHTFSESKINTMGFHTHQHPAYKDTKQVLCVVPQGFSFAFLLSVISCSTESKLVIIIITQKLNPNHLRQFYSSVH